MKLLVSDPKNVVLVFVTLLLIFNLHTVNYAQQDETTDNILAVSDRTSQVRDAIVAAVQGVTDAANVTNTQLAAIRSLNLRNKSITSLKSGDFSGMTGLTDINLFGNQLSSLPNGIFKGLTALTELRLGGNTVTPMQIPITLEETDTNNYKVSIPTGAPFDITVSIVLTDGIDPETLRSVTVAKGSVESASFTAESVEGSTVEIGETLPSLPQNHYGYTLTKVVSSTETVAEPETQTQTEEIQTETQTEETENSAPTFSDGTIGLRSVPENTAADTNIGNAFSATDTDTDDTLTYTLAGRDAASFAIDSTTGQLKTKAALDYETKNIYLVSITVSDSTMTDTISVVISIIDVADTTISTAALGVSDRTPEVRDAIVEAVPGVTNASDVTNTHLGAITALDLRNNGITALKPGDFSGLTGLTSLNIHGNMLSTLPYGIFNGLTSLTSLRLGGNVVNPMPMIVSLEQVNSNQYRVVIPTGAPFDVVVPIRRTDGGNIDQSLGTVTVSKGSIRSAVQTVASTSGTFIDIGRLPSLPTNHFGYVLAKSVTCNVTLPVAEAIAAAIPGVTNCRNVSVAQLAAITSLNLSNKSITSLQRNDFGGLLSLSTLNLQDNQLSSLPNGIFAELISLSTLQLTGNTGTPFSFEVSLEKVGTDQFKAVMPIGAPFNIAIPINVANGSAANSASSITIPIGSVESSALTISRTTNTFDAVTVDIGTLPSVPSTHNGYALLKSTNLPLEIFEEANSAPIFTAGTTTSRSIAENTAAGTNIGAPISATDPNSSDTLTYSLGGTDASVFSINSSTGQLQTKSALNYELKNSYIVTVTVSDNRGGSDSINVTINITNVRNEGTQPQIEGNQDENRVSNNHPVFTDGTNTTRSIAENTASGTNIGTVIAATDRDTTDTLTYTLGGTDAASFSIVSSSGQLQTKAALDYETKATYTVTISVSDGNGGTDSINVTINVTDVVESGSNTAPVFTDGNSVVRYMAENTPAGVNIGAAIAATDEDAGNTLTYTLSGTDAASFSIESTSGQLKTKAALDYETKQSYSVTITVSDGRGGTDTIAVTINISNVHENVAPEFPYSATTTRSIPENTAVGTNIGSPVAATDANENDTLTYTISGTDAASFSIVSSSGQLQTNAALDYETKSSYTITVTVSDGHGGTDTVNVTISVTNVHENIAPVFTAGATATRAIAENSVAGTNIGLPLRATDANGTDILTFSLGGTDAASFAISSATGQLQTKAALDYETKNTYTIIVTVSDGTLTDTISVTINITDIQEGVANSVPTFTDGDSTTRSINENTDSGRNIGSAVSATDLDSDDTLTYTLSGTDAGSFAIVSTTGQLQTYSDLNYETKSSYSVTINVSDGRDGTDSINVTININDVNDPPRFVDGNSDVVTLSEDYEYRSTWLGQYRIIDEDADTLFFTLPQFASNPFHADFIQTYDTGVEIEVDPITFEVTRTPTGEGYWRFNIKRRTELDYETRPRYTYRFSVSDGSVSVTFNLTINITDVAETAPAPPAPPPANIAPLFYNDTDAMEISENIGANANVGYLPHRNEDDDPLTFWLTGTDADSFVMSGAHIKTKSASDFVAFDYETKSTYSVIGNMSDGRGGTDTSVVTINITNVNEAPEFDDGSTTTRTIAENTAADVNIGNGVSATDQDANDTVTYTLGGTDAASFSIDSTSGQLKTKAALDYETKSSYTVTITATDNGNLTDSITVTINVRDLNETPTNNPPVFTEGTTATRSIAENTASDTNIGNPITATDQDANSTLSYQLSGKDAASFSIVESTGQLKTNAALDYETKSSYKATVTVTDGTLTDTITVTINITDANDAPVFSDGISTTRSIDEGTDADTNIGATVLATDADADDLTYTLGGTDAAAFAIVSTSGQLKTKAALRFETKSAYSVTVTVSDGKLTDTINLTINVNNVNRGGPAFTEDSITLSVEEGVPVGTFIGEPFTAVDIDDDTLEYDVSAYSTEGTQSGHWFDFRYFDIDPNTGQLKTKAVLSYDTKKLYKISISANDIQYYGYIDVIINVVRRNNSPVFTDGISATRSVAENTAAGQNIGTPIAATDEDNDTLTYSLGGTDANSFNIDSATGQLKTKAELDYETKTSYTVTVTTTDNKPRGSIAVPVTINVTDVPHEDNSAPEFTDGATTTRTVAENTATGADIGTAVAATDEDTDDTITYTLGGTDAASFDIVSTTGQLQTKAELDYETKSSYTVTITASDGKTNGSDTISVTINVTDVDEANNAPEFTEGATATRSIAENTAAGTNIGSVVSATDEDTHNTLTYTLGGTDAASFDIVSTTGQLQTKDALDYETKTTYIVTVSVSDGAEGTDSISVTINVTDVLDTNQVPVFSDGATTSLSIVENTAAGEEIGDPITASDPDGDTFTYSFGGTDASVFDFDTSTAQVKTNAALDYETKSSYTVTITASDSQGGTATITVTINVTDSTSENTPPVFSDGSTITLSLDERLDEDKDAWYDTPTTESSRDIGSPITATDADGHTLTYSVSGDNAWIFDIDSSGQLSSWRWFDYEDEKSLSVTVDVSDSNGGSDSINVTININDLNERPKITGSRTIYVETGTSANSTIGNPVSASDPDANTTLTYSLSGTDSNSFTINSSTAQLTTGIDLDADTQATYSVVVTVSDGEKSATSNVTIKVTRPPDPLVSARSAAVRQAIVTAVSGVDSVADINSAHLATITILDLENKSISSISAGDFNDLTSLEDLDLSDNQISSLPAAIFDDLTSLRRLDLRYNQIRSLSGDVFENNTSLRKLYLAGNRITSLPDGLFEGLTSLDALGLEGVNGERPDINMTLVKLDDDDDNLQTAKYKITVHTGAPETLSLEVWSVKRVFDFVWKNEKIGKHADVTVSAGSLASSVFSIERSDNLTEENNRNAEIRIAIYGIPRRNYPPVPYYSGGPGMGGFRYHEHTDWNPVRIIPALTSAAPLLNGQSIPDATTLLPNFPNPFNPETWIPYQLKDPSDVSITVYDIRGTVVRTLDLGHQKAGFYTDRSRAAHWDGKNRVGERVANGVYFYQLKAGDYSYLRKMLIVK